MTADSRLVCRRCGFSNVPGDQFCGSCGAFLEWEGEPVDSAHRAAPTPVDRRGPGRPAGASRGRCRPDVGAVPRAGRPAIGPRPDRRSAPSRTRWRPRTRPDPLPRLRHRERCHPHLLPVVRHEGSPRRRGSREVSAGPDRRGGQRARWPQARQPGTRRRRTRAGRARAGRRQVDRDHGRDRGPRRVSAPWPRASSCAAMDRPRSPRPTRPSR